MNEQKHWNRIAGQYNQQIFDVFASDRNKVLSVYFKKHSDKKGLAIDFGCGNGKAFRFLSPRFRKVIGCDISENLLKDAAKHGFENVELLHRDLALADTGLPKADFLFSCNVIMLPDAAMNLQMFHNVAASLKRNGAAVLVVPSTESMMYTSWMLTELYRQEGVRYPDIDADEFGYFQGKRQEIASGVFYIDGVPTRHYTGPELHVIARQAGLKITALKKVKYNWDSEIADPPKDMKGPYPWDWLVECRKD